MIVSQLATHAFYGILWETIHINSENEKINIHTEFDSMRKTFYILSLIIMSLLSFGATVHGQTASNNSDLPLKGTSLKTKDTCCYTDNDIYGLFSESKLKDTYNETYVNDLFRRTSVRRINDTILILSSTKDSTQFKLTSSKGYLYFQEDNYSSLIKAKRWKVKNLKEEDKEITLNIYNDKTNELLCNKRYSLIPDPKGGVPKDYKARSLNRKFRIELHYFDRTGKEKVYDGDHLSTLSINYNIPMKVVAKDTWDVTHRIDHFQIDIITRAGDKIKFICNGNTISQKAMEKIRVLKPNERFFISETMLGYSEYICIKRQLAPIEIIK